MPRKPKTKRQRIEHELAVRKPPAPPDPPPVDYPDVMGQGFLFDIDPEDQVAPAGVDPEKYWSREFRRMKTLIAQVDLKVKRGELIPKDQVEQLLVDRITEFTQALTMLESALAPDLVNLADPREAKAILHRGFRELLERYSRPVEGAA